MGIVKMQEHKRIEKVAQRFKIAEGFNGKLYKYRLEILTSLIGKKRNSVLELGCGDGIVTAFLAKKFKRIVSVDGSAAYIKRARKIIGAEKNILFIKSLFENFSTTEKFDCVLCLYILEHVREPIKILRKAKKFLKDNGYLIIFVPNKESLHRRMGKALGLIKKLGDITKIDRFAGHRRVYDLKLFKSHIRKAGLECIEAGGCFIKPLSNRQMAFWNDKICDALFEIGRDFPEMCSEIYAKCIIKK
jgi:2-polyprenyl-3-methyl-5-hydroxy-6-metoxy-1,4-benzoquinol methylase